MPGSFLVFDRHSGFWGLSEMSTIDAQVPTFLACFLALRCFAAEDFSILFRRRTGTRFDLGSNSSFRLRTI
jgi:hypothetical protein